MSHRPSVRHRPFAPLLVPLLLSASAAWAQPRYTLTELAPVVPSAFAAQALDINNAGQILFSGFEAAGSANRNSVWLYTPGSGTVNLASAIAFTPPAGQTVNVEGWGLNNQGQVVGVWDTRGRVGARTPWQAYVYDTTSGMRVLNDNIGGEGISFEINDRGQVAGFADVQGQRYTFLHDTVTQATTAVDGVGIGFGDGALNNAGQLAGVVFDLEAQTTRTVIHDSETGITTDLGAVSLTSRPRAMNDAGWVVGEQYNADDLRRAFVYRPDGGFTTLDLLPGQPPDLEAGASDVNARGQVIGNNFGISDEAIIHGFLLDPSFGLLAIEDLIVGAAGQAWRSVGVSAINDAGQMVGSALGQDGAWHAVLLDPWVAAPVPEPGTAVLLLSGLGVTAWARRRRA